MEELIENLVWSVNSFSNKENTKAEMLRVLYNKKQRAANDREYIKTLITNIGYYTILTINTFQLMRHCFSNNETPTLNLVTYLIDDIKSKGSDDIYYKEVEQDYIGANAKSNHGMDFIEKLEFDYVHYCYMVNLTQGFIEYLDNEVNKHTAKKLEVYISDNIVEAVHNEIRKCTISFTDFYSPPKYAFVR